MTSPTDKPTPRAHPRVATGLKAEPPRASDAMIGPAELRVERQGLTGRRWAWRLVRDGRTLLASDRQFDGAEAAHEDGMRVWRSRAPAA
ncbi:hypothetical protein ACE7GA_01310 [Roseomonas sp. CCTCC AB2023176]|uniref:hypothetical protein n=1 Tax=Roseomonas sp. CCTCC AB2023176 TaxID=3342640 RepID=UPI0035D58389